MMLRQTRFGKDGNCWAACIASWVGCPLGDVPDFSEMPGPWLLRCEEWLAARGYEIRLVAGQAAGAAKASGALLIAGGISPRGVDHSVLWRGNAMVFDPHPSDAGLVGEPDWFAIIERKERCRDKETSP